MLGKPISSLDLPSWSQMAAGHMGGSLGEISAIALLLGALYLLYKGYITWHTPISFIGTAVVLGHIFHLVKPEAYPSGMFHLVSGGLMLGALFMATDMVTSPMTGKGQLIFAAEQANDHRDHSPVRRLPGRRELRHFVDERDRAAHRPVHDAQEVRLRTAGKEDGR